MKQFLYIFIVGILFYLQSCNTLSTEIVSTMNAAEELMIERPDSALKLLDNIHIDEISSRRDRAKYAVLYTQAKDKNFIDETDLSLIGDAKRYYEDSNDVEAKFLSLYYYGRILCNSGDYSHAIIAYTQAESILDELNNSYMAGLLYTEIGNIYRSYYDYSKCLEAFQTASDYYTLSGLESHNAYALLDMGIAYWNLENPAKAEEYYNKALDIAFKHNDKYLERICCENLIMVYDGVGDKEKSGYIVGRLYSDFDENLFSPACLGAIASYYADVHNFKMADSRLMKAWENARSETDSVSLFFQSANIMKTMGRYDDAWHYFGKGIKLQNNQLRFAMQQPILSSQKEYFENQAEYNAYRLEKNTEIYITLSIIIVLITIVITIYMRYRMLTKDLEISKYMDLAKELQASILNKDIQLSEISLQVEADNSRLNEMSNHIVKLFHKQYELLDKLSNTYYETHGYSREKESIYEQVKSEINKFANDKKSIAQLETIVNTYKRNVINLIRSDIPGISERDVKLLCYIYAGFSAKSISIFVGETTNNIITRKYRLRIKISKLDTPNKNVILQEMP